MFLREQVLTATKCQLFYSHRTDPNIANTLTGSRDVKNTKQMGTLQDEILSQAWCFQLKFHKTPRNNAARNDVAPLFTQVDRSDIISRPR